MMSVYFHFMVLNLKSRMQYKLSFFLSTVGQFLSAFTAFFGLQFMLERINAIDEFTHGQVLLSFAVIMAAFAIGEFFGGGLGSFDYVMKSGFLDRYMVRPRSVLLQVIMPNVDFVRFGILFQSVVVLCWAIPASGIAWTPFKIITLIVMILSGSALFFSLFLLNAACAFFTTQSLKFMDFFTYGMRQFGRYPFSVYGSFMLRFLTFVIPLATFQYYPLLYLIDRSDNIWYLIAPLLGLLFLIPCGLLFRLGIRQYKSIGS